MRNLTIVIIILLILTGCSLTPINLNEPAVIEFTIEEGYQSAYRNILEQSRECYTSHMIPFISINVTIDGDLYTDIQEGHIRIATDFGLWNIINVKAISDKQTRVAIYAHNPSRTKNRNNAIEQFAKRTAICADFK